MIFEKDYLDEFIKNSSIWWEITKKVCGRFFVCHFLLYNIKCYYAASYNVLKIIKFTMVNIFTLKNLAIISKSRLFCRVYIWLNIIKRAKMMSTPLTDFKPRMTIPLTIRCHKMVNKKNFLKRNVSYVADNL